LEITLSGQETGNKSFLRFTLLSEKESNGGENCSALHLVEIECECVGMSFRQQSP
jgi:hypothetical protein